MINNTTSHFCFLFIEGVGAEHLSDGLECSSERKHELFKLVLILTCQRHRKSLKLSFYMMLICYIYRYTLTQVYHKKSSQGCVESGPTPHVTEVGLIVHTQERKVLTLSHRRKTRHLSALESYSKNNLRIVKLLFVKTLLSFFFKKKKGLAPLCHCPLIVLQG